MNNVVGGPAAEALRRGCLSSLRVLDLSYNGSVGDDGWSAMLAAGGLGSLEELDLSLRPLSSAPCSGWLHVLLAALPRMPALARLAMWRWSAGPQERRQLEHSTRSRRVQLESDQNLTGSEWKEADQEESQPEE